MAALLKKKTFSNLRHLLRWGGGMRGVIDLNRHCQ